MRRMMISAALVLLAACGGGGDDGADTVTDTSEPTANAGEPAADTFPTEAPTCVLADGDEITKAALDDYCALEADPDVIVAFQMLDCDDGSTMYFAGSSADDPDGGSVIFDEAGNGVWRVGSYGERYGTECVPGGSL